MKVWTVSNTGLGEVIVMARVLTDVDEELLESPGAKLLIEAKEILIGDAAVRAAKGVSEPEVEVKELENDQNDEVKSPEDSEESSDEESTDEDSESEESEEPEESEESGEPEEEPKAKKRKKRSKKRGR